ncbi:MAG: hypothetical protein K1X57_00875 [Gemmataceae bacterium]|nr:hypothetical protein [Gemmataceae bacterium]
MIVGKVIRVFIGVSVMVGLASGAFLTRDRWLPLVTPTTTADAHAADEHSHDPAAVGEPQQVHLTPEAQSNLRLVAKPLKAETYWRTIPVPGVIVDRPAHSDRGVVAPVTGVVTKVYSFPGDTIRPGEPLFSLRLLSEALHQTQSELFKTTQDIVIAQDQKKRLAPTSQSGAIPESKLIEIDNQLRRLTVAAQAYRQELLTRGFTPPQIDAVAQGTFVSEIRVSAPQPAPDDKSLATGVVKTAAVASEASPTYEVQELKVELGQQVQAGQLMVLLSNHQLLYIEGRAFRQETPLIERSAKEGWTVQVEFMEEAGSGWPHMEQSFAIRHIANTIDTASRTFAFFLPLTNQSRSFEKDGKKLLLWRYRPGQKVRLHIRVEQFDNVFVLPADAVVREGPEAYVFRQNGDNFDRKPVRVIFQDRQHVVIANDGGIPPGLFVAQNGASQMNRVLKAQGGSATAGFHIHADGSIHKNGSH